MQPTVALTCFESPLPVGRQAAQIESMTASERARIARIYRPLRRDQFIVGHALLRRLLAVSGFDDVAIEVDADGRARVEPSRDEWHVSIAHSGGTVAAIVASEPVGIDLEANRTLSDPRAAAVWLGLPDDPAVESEQVLTAWVAAEARFKAGPNARQRLWQTRWQRCLVAVAGVAAAPQTLVFGMMAGTYNRTELRWDVVASAAAKLG
jgi:4'-phosphopantetheinyl transferase EntD